MQHRPDAFFMLGASHAHPTPIALRDDFSGVSMEARQRSERHRSPSTCIGQPVFAAETIDPTELGQVSCGDHQATASRVPGN